MERETCDLCGEEFETDDMDMVGSLLVCDECLEEAEDAGEDE